MAEIDITPPIGHRMAGYFDERLATGIHDPLHAKAIVLQQENEKIALVFCDLVGISLNVSKKARAEASRQTGIPISHILIAATHSHTGPLFDDTRRKYLHDAALAKFGNDPAEKIYYPDFLAGALVKVIGQAAAQLQPAELETTVARREALAFNRRYHMKNGKVACNPGVLNPNIVRPAGPVDPDVGVLLIKIQKKFLGGLTVFAVHLDCVGGTLYSADCAYYVEQTLRKSLGEKFISAYAAGTCGDLNNINVNTNELTKGYPVAEKIGTALGQTILQEIPKLTPIKHPSLKVRSE
ncbi:MAG: neutral/alkaline non-lysosomal ceramidase N-terminal domain-containing protein, partial [Limisphaerales bacterium]